MTDPALTGALTRVAELMADARGSWWVIGSAAVALHGAPVTVTRDVDVLADPGDMAMLAAKTGTAAMSGVADERFRSAQMLTLDGPLAIELFADFDVRGGNGTWRRLGPVTRVMVDHDGMMLPVPEKTELIDILTRFARPKDLARAALLRAGPRR